MMNLATVESGVKMLGGTKAITRVAHTSGVSLSGRLLDYVPLIQCQLLVTT